MLRREKMLHITLYDSQNSAIRSKIKVKDILEKDKGDKMKMGRAHSKKGR